ncbi:MAG: hypothetical protein IKH26_05280 [Bacteroidaceae bacterium]|nr:hypothetical protein [Bacteroidaceae bacterium]
MTTTDDIRKMVERFFDGETTLDEEKMLYAYFASEEVDPTLLPYKRMYCDFNALPFDKSTNIEVNKPTHLQTDKTVAQESDKTLTSRPITPQTTPDKNDKQESFPILNKNKHHWHWPAVAAIIVAVSLIGSWAYRSYREKLLFDRYEGSYMIVNGERIDDLNRIHRHIEQTLAQAETSMKDNDTYTFIQNAENELLSDIGDNSMREEIQRMLNE